MNNIEQTRKTRERFLILLYEKTKQDINEDIDYREICNELGLDENEGWKIYEYLKAKGFAYSTVIGGYINITISGIDIVEEILSASGVDANNSQQVMNFIQIQNMNNSQITQASANITQTLNVTENQGLNLLEFVKLFEEKYKELPFESVDDENEAIAEVQTIKSQLTSPRPKVLIIQEAIKSVTSILEGFTGSMLATMLIEYLNVNK